MEWFFCSKLFAASHQTWHLALCQIELLTSKFSQPHVFHFGFAHWNLVHRNALCGDHGFGVCFTAEAFVVLLCCDHAQAFQHAQGDLLKIQCVEVQTTCTGIKTLLAQVGSKLDGPLLEGFVR